MKKISVFLLAFCFVLSGVAQNKNAQMLLDELDSLMDEGYHEAEQFVDSVKQLDYFKDSLDFQHYIDYKRAIIHSEAGLFDEADKYFLAARQLAQAAGNQERSIKYLLAHANNDLNQGKLDGAVEKGIQATEIAAEIKDSVWLARSYINLGESYRIHNQFDLALTQQRKALAIGRELKSETLLGMSYNNIAATLGEIGQNEEAIDTLLNGLKLMDEENFFAKAKFNSNLGFCYRNMEMFDKAMEHHKIALAFKKKARMESSLGYTYGAIGRSYLGLEELDSAIKYTLLEYQHGVNYNDPYLQKDAANHVAEAYYENEDFKKSIDYLLIGKDLEDSLFDLEIEQKSILYQRKYDLSQKENELNRLKVERALEESEKKYLTVGLISSLVVLLLIAVIFYLRSNRKAQARKIIEMQLTQVKQENEQNKLALSNYTKELMLKNQRLLSLDKEVEAKEAELSEIRNSKSEELDQLGEMKLLTDVDWVKFKKLFEKVYPQFFNKLNAEGPSFTKGEKRLMALMKLNMENAEIAGTLGISSESVSKSKFRLKKKLSEHQHSSIEEFVHSI